MEFNHFKSLSPTAYAEGLNRSQFMDIGIRELWPQIPRIAGPAFTVQLSHGDNLMLHAAIYEAPAGSIIVVDAQDSDYAVAGGNVCAIAKKRGIVGFVIDGVIRDLAEVREDRFPVFARGVIPIPGKKEIVGLLNTPLSCGGVNVCPGDIVIADEEGIAVIPYRQQGIVYEKAKNKTAIESNQSLDDWEAAHRKKISDLLHKNPLN